MSSFVFISDHGAAPTASGVLEKANLLLMTKEANDKDKSLKTELLLSTTSQSPEKISNKQVWKKQGYFLTREAILMLKTEIFLRRLYATLIRNIF